MAEPTAEADLFGKRVSDIQENMSGFDTGKLTGISKFIKDYSGIPVASDRTGNFLALHFNQAGEGYTVKVGFEGGKETTLDTDGNYVVKLKNKKPLNVTVTNGADTGTKQLDISGITLNPDVTEELVKEALTNAAESVNKSMDYAKLAVENNKATCTISNGGILVTKVYTDIISGILEELKKNADKFAKIKGGSAEINIKPGQNLQATEVVALVKAVLPDIQPTDPISKLYNKNVELTVVGTDGDEFNYTLEFKNNG